MNYEQEIKTVIEADVIVIGAGPGGIGAAVTAARNGADTVIIERYNAPGGMAVFGEVCPFMCNHLDGESLDKPVYTQWRNLMFNYTPDTIADGENEDHIKRHIGIPEAMLAAEDLLLEAGVRPVYHHQLFNAEVKDGKIERVILFSKSGLTAAKAKVYIDCTGDADLAAKAGCEIEYGNDEGLCQPMTTCFKLEDIDMNKFCAHYFPEEQEKNFHSARKILTKVYLEAKEKGEVDCPREDILLFNWYSPDVIHFNTTRVTHHHAIDGLSLSDAEVMARRQIRQLLKLFRSKVVGFEKARLRSIAAHIGVRESRRVVGRAFLSGEQFDFEKAVFPHFPDSIARINYPIDIHNPSGSGTILKHFPKGTWYEVPYGCIVPKNIDNLLVGGRPISADHGVHSSLRVMPPACSIGQAAGMAAAVAVAKNITPPEVNGIELHEKLKEFGASL